jgi:hypothetical protein
MKQVIYLNDNSRLEEEKSLIDDSSNGQITKMFNENIDSESDISHTNIVNINDRDY